MVLFLFIPIILFYLIKKLIFPKKANTIENKHVVITGGSSGIGRSVAVLAAQQGAHVTIIARDLKKLGIALTDVKQACVNVSQKVQCISVDVSDFTAIEHKLNTIEETVGPIYMLVNCAGMAICGKLEDMSVEDIKTLVDINYLGTVYPIKAVVPKMKQRNEGIIVITASQGALVGIFGLAAYAASKFALRGFAEALDMELGVHNISITVSLPPDTDTPGFETENKSKPVETSLICKSGGLYHPDVIAAKLLDDALSGKFFSYVGFESFMSTTLSVGMTRYSSAVDVIIQSILLGPIRIISCFYLAYFHRIINKCRLNENKNK